MVRWQRETVSTCCVLKPFWVKSDHQQFQRSTWDIMDFVSIDESKVIVHHLLLLRRLCLKCNTLDVQHRKPPFALSAIFAARLAPCLCCGCRKFRCVELTTCCKAQTEPVLLRGGIRLPTCWWSAVHWTCACASSTAFPDLDAAWSAWNWAGVWSYHPGQGFARHSIFNVLHIIMLKQDIFLGPWQP